MFKNSMVAFALFLLWGLWASCGNSQEQSPSVSGSAIAGAEQQPAATRAAASIYDLSLNDTVKDRSQFESAPHYKLSLSFDYDLFTFDAREELRYTNNEGRDLKRLYFLLYPNSKELLHNEVPNLSIQSVRAVGKDLSFKVDGVWLEVLLGSALSPGESIQVDIDFKGVVYRQPKGSTDPEKMAMEQLVQMVMGDGLHHGGYGIYSYGESVVSLALWYPILIAYADGAWDLKEASTMGDVSHFDVANVELDVVAPDHVEVVATGVRHKKSAEASGRTRHSFAAAAVRECTVQMSHEYTSVSDEVDGVRVTSWYRKGFEEKGAKVLEYAKKSLEVFNKDFGPYPYTELDVAQAPLVGGAGGVEFPGLVTIASMFYGDKPGAPDDSLRTLMSGGRYMQDTLEFVVAHEVAHQWWNAIVGSDSKEHPFVDEALANHSAILYFDRVHGAEAAERQRELQLRLPYQMARMTGAKDRPVDLPTAEYNSAMEYAAIVYGKGALFFEELRSQNGDEVHFAFLRDYYDRFKFKIATTEDLIGGLVAASNDPKATQKLADRWLKGTYGDEDIGDVDLMSVAELVLGEMGDDPELRQLMQVFGEGGLLQMAQELSNIITPDGGINPDFDMEKIDDVLRALMGDDASEVSGILKAFGELERLLDPASGKPDLKGLMNLTKEMLGSDKETKDLLDAAEPLLRHLLR